MSYTVITNANTYAEMSRSFYEQYLKAQNRIKRLSVDKTRHVDINWYAEYLHWLDESEKNAIAAVVFQAMAIEAYTNLFGLYTLGEEVFYDQGIERKKLKEKLSKICESLSQKYPTEHFEKIDALFKKRDNLVHQKPHLYEIPDNLAVLNDNEVNRFIKTTNELKKDMERVYRNLEKQMELYSQFQENIRLIRDADKELIEEITEKRRKENCDS